MRDRSSAEKSAKSVHIGSYIGHFLGPFLYASGSNLSLYMPPSWLRRLIFNKHVDYFRVIGILNITDTRSLDLDSDTHSEDKLAKAFSNKAPI